MKSVIPKVFHAPELWILGIFSFLTRFWNLGFPGKVVFDESYFGLFATKYLSGQYYFDIHPPLVKLLFGFFAWISGAKPGFDFLEGSAYGDFPYLFLRILSASVGWGVVVLAYLFMRKLKFSRRVAFLAGFFVLFDNAFLIQSRLILMDIFLLFFILVAFYFFWHSRELIPGSRRWYLFLTLCGVFLGFASSVKLIGVIALGIVWFWEIAYEHLPKKDRKYIFQKAIFLLLVPFLIFEGIFAVHLSIVHTACMQDCGAVFEKKDIPRDFYERVNTPPEGNLLHRLWKDNYMMWQYNVSSIGASHYYESVWHTWPFMIRPVQYAQVHTQEGLSSLYFLGNPFVWWSSLLGIIGIFYIAIRRYLHKIPAKVTEPFYSPQFKFLLLAFFMFFLMFAAIRRSLFLYHYMYALLFLTMISSVYIDTVLVFFKKRARIIYALILLSALFVFLYFSPLTYGIPLTEDQFHTRMWLPTWDY